jgi:1,4-alpha-glucan branching enzyme
MSTSAPVHYTYSRLTADDLHLFNEGSHFRLFDKLGAHPVTHQDQAGVYFAVWAPDAEQVSVIGDFNQWNNSTHCLRSRDQSGIWEGFVPGLAKGTVYKYHVASRYHGYRADKADPFAFTSEVSPLTGSRVWSFDYQWNDRQWMSERQRRNAPDAPMAIYEVHLGSWMKIPEEGNRPLSYREMGPRLADYVKRMGFTHVEFMPVMEHPFYGSWGYQVTGFFAPTSRYGDPEDLMYAIDCLHQHGIGVILDWVPSHFPTDEHGIGYFDGTHLYEHADARQGIHPEWDSFIFNYGRNEVRSFLLSNALFWLDRYHADGLRVDAVASMLYLDYARNEGEWVPNPYGGKENIEAIEFLRRFNHEVYANFPAVQTIAEESTDWSMVSRPTYVGGLGFGMKWDMGWMHDTLVYFSKDPIHRKFHHDQLTFRMLYAFHENFVLPLSHDEVVHGKGSLLQRMPGDEWQKFANLRLLFGYMYAQPGKKLLFMGAEFAQWNEWYHEVSLDWHLLAYPLHDGMHRWVADLNHLYQEHPALHQLDFHPHGFQWIDCNDSLQSTISLIRRGRNHEDSVIAVSNFTPVPRLDYRVGVPSGGVWQELLNSDAPIYGGSGMGNLGAVRAAGASYHGFPFSLTLTIPPLAIVFLKPVPGA